MWQLQNPQDGRQQHWNIKMATTPRKAGSAKVAALEATVREDRGRDRCQFF
jgi:hypothetical protein